ncbi:MAG: TatD family hydrolase [Candidatus Paceibacterota bacterium]|jgi:TatD DNase family protein
MTELKFFDIHGHLNFADYDKDRDEVVNRALENGVWQTAIGTDRESSAQALLLAEKYENGVYAIIGAHPTTNEEFDYEFYKKLATNPKVVAIGECGLDYFRDGNKKQEEIFRKQIELANEIEKPLMLHIRNGKNISAYRLAAEILKEKAKVIFNSHFFAGNLEEARLLLDLGATFSFTGVITFTNDYDEIIKYLPLERIMAETDCPFVTPLPHRGKRNEPVYVIEVVKKIAEIRNEDLEKVRKQLFQNSFAFFNLSC